MQRIHNQVNVATKAATTARDWCRAATSSDKQSCGIFRNHGDNILVELEIIQFDGPVQQHLYPPFYLTTPKEWIKIHNTRQQNDNYKKLKKKACPRKREREGEREREREREREYKKIWEEATPMTK
jgi:hypothetical protein